MNQHHETEKGGKQNHVGKKLEERADLKVCTTDKRFIDCFSNRYIVLQPINHVITSSKEQVCHYGGQTSYCETQQLTTRICSNEYICPRIAMQKQGGRGLFHSFSFLS